MIGICMFPALFLSPFAGVLVDRWDRKQIMIISDIARSLCVASVPISLVLGRLTMIQLYFCSFTEMTFTVFFDLAEASRLPSIVDKEQLSKALGQSTAITYIASLFGSSLSGIFYSIGHAFPFLADAISYIISAISFIFTKAQFQQKQLDKHQNVWVEMREGISWVWGHKLFRTTTILIALLNFTGAGLNLVIILIAQQQHASPFTIGIVFTIGSIGGIAGAFLFSLVQKYFSFIQIVLGVVCLTTVIWPLLLIAPNLIILGGLFALYMCGGRLLNVTMVNYRTECTPEEMRGRVFSVYWQITQSCPPIGVALIGILLPHIGLMLTVIFITASRVIPIVSTSKALIFAAAK